MGHLYGTLRALLNEEGDLIEEPDGASSQGRPRTNPKRPRVTFASLAY